MRTRILISGCMVFFALFVNPVMAANLTVQLTGRVVSVDDPGNALGGLVSNGQTVTGSYSYETTVPDQDPASFEYGLYPQAPGQGSTSVSVGPYTFATDPNPTTRPWMYQIHVRASPMYQDLFVVQSGSNKPLANGALVHLLDVFLADMSSAAISSDALPTTAPNLASFDQHSVYIGGNSPSGSSYFIRIEIDSMTTATTLGCSSKTISPASSRFMRMQRVEPVIFLPDNKPFLNVTASMDGVLLPPVIISQCHMVPLMLPGRQAVICPDVMPLLRNGKNIVEWRVNMLDGSTFSDKVEWEVVD